MLVLPSSFNQVWDWYCQSANIGRGISGGTVKDLRTEVVSYHLRMGMINGSI